MAKYWYQAEMMNGGGDPLWYLGSSNLDLPEITGEISAGRFVCLDDLVYFNDQDKAISWSEWDPLYTSQVSLNPRYIVSIMPLADDPRKKSREEGVLLRLPSSRRGRED